ncbi:hypothetical protein LOCC1_G000602 [Lachnellula occidentalis]|uniref:Rhodopsin domain-containing protein n=1 Tax=Lachnellula occidentalis TaxID=215460 RepID=A0A8H8UKM0_9HELO|nr:hypothetical protein LOCC1_G000602 [Lachnellula occidentalis]
MQLPPLEVLAALPKPNYVDPVTRADAKVILNVVLYTILLSFIGLRIYTRTHLRKFFGTDDILILVALIPTSVFFIMSVLGDTKFHWTRHSHDIPPSEIPRGLKVVLCTELMFAAACTLTKLSMLASVYLSIALGFYSALAESHFRCNCRGLVARRRFLHFGDLPVQVSHFLLFPYSGPALVKSGSVRIPSKPPSHYWRVTFDPQPECINEAQHLLIAGIINTLTDFVAVALPIRTVLSLQLRAKQIIPIVVLFGFGFLSCCCGIVRTYYTYKASTSHDQIWDSYPVWITAALELCIGVICASIPATKPFFSTILPHIFGSIDPLSGPSAYRHTYTSRQLNQSRSANMMSSIPDTQAEHGEELLNLEKALGGENSDTKAPEKRLRIRQTDDEVMGQRGW